MSHVKTFGVIILLMIVAIALAGCASLTSSGNSATVNPMVVANTVGDPTPVPTDPPVPTQGPTWTPTPTPIPDPVTLSKFNLVGTINGDQKKISDDPNQGMAVNAPYATRQDTANFTVKNTGSVVLEDLSIIYETDVPMTAVDSVGRSSTTVMPKNTTLDVGTLKPGDSRAIVIKSQLYGAMLEVNMSIIAKWKGGSFQLYHAKLDPSFTGGVMMGNPGEAMTAGSSNNY